MEENIDNSKLTSKIDAQHKKLKYKLENLQRIKKKLPIVLGLLTTVFLSLLFRFFLLNNLSNTITISGVIYSGFISILFGIVIAIYTVMILEINESKLQQKILEFEAENIQDKVQDDVFENSIKMSYKYLDQYYLQTKEQAQKGFFITVCVSIFGAILIGVGIVAMFLQKMQPSYVTCASGVITEFIAAIFFYLYNKTVISMSKYHNKLVLSHNISIALKVAETLPDEHKTLNKNLIIKELLKDVNTYLIQSDPDDSK